MTTVSSGPVKTEQWRQLQSDLQGQLSDEDSRILALLAEGKTQPEIGRRLGLHRSAVWRRVSKLKKKGLQTQ